MRTGANFPDSLNLDRFVCVSGGIPNNLVTILVPVVFDMKTLPERHDDDPVLPPIYSCRLHH